MSLLKSAGGAQLQQDSPACDRGAAARTAARTAERVIRIAAAQRVRWGLTGLAAIFLLVLGVSAGLRPAASTPVDSRSEPLAVLGVAPGSGPAVFDRDGEPRMKAARASRT